MNEQLQAAFDKKFKDTWFFEDVPLNHATPATTGRTITEADILNFAGISGEWAPIHMDLEYCKAHGHDSVLAQHMLIYTFTPSINPSDPMMAKMNNSILATKGTKNWKFLKMPAVGDTVYTTSEIVAKDDNKPERGVIIIQMSMIDQNGDVLQTGEYHLVVAQEDLLREAVRSCRRQGAAVAPRSPVAAALEGGSRQRPRHGHAGQTGTDPCHPERSTAGAKSKDPVRRQPQHSLLTQHGIFRLRLTLGTTGKQFARHVHAAERQDDRRRKERHP